MKSVLFGTLFQSLFAAVAVLGLPSSAASQTQIVHVRAWIDGRSDLILLGSSVQWQHYDFAAPGRLDCDIGMPHEATYVDGNPWYPVWPDVPTCENRDCGGCFSDSANLISPALPIDEFHARLVPWGGGEGELSVHEQPYAGNGYRTVVRFDDNAFAGASWYEFDLYIERCYGDSYCTSTPNSTGRSAFIVAGGDLSLSGTGAVLQAYYCAADRPGIFFYGTGIAKMPLANGTLCIDPFSGIHRIMAMRTDQDGFVHCPLDLSALPFAPDTTYYMQFWFRDTLGGGAGSNLTDAVRVRFCP
jgi:hypothetical protein